MFTKTKTTIDAENRRLEQLAADIREMVGENSGKDNIIDQMLKVREVLEVLLQRAAR